MGSETQNTANYFEWYRARHILQIVIVTICISFSNGIFAGKHAYPEIKDQIAHDVVEILGKYGMPVSQNRTDRWFRIGAGADSWIGGKPSYAVYLFEAHQVPLAAQLEIIQYCMTLHEARGRRERIRIEMRSEAFEPRFFQPKPYFELTLNNME